MGVILGIAVLLDAALVRLLLVPVLLRLLGTLGVVAAEAARPPAARRPLRPRLTAPRLRLSTPLTSYGTPPMPGGAAAGTL